MKYTSITKPVPKFVTYKRLSIEDKSRVQHGFNSQQRDIEIFLEAFSDYSLVGEFQEFVSGAADFKPELEKALELCKETGAHLLIAKVDRLSRRVAQVANYLEGDVKFRVACMPQADNFQIQIYSVLAEQERQFIKDRVKKGLAVVKENTPEKLSKKEGTKWHKTFTANKAKGLHATTRNREASRKAKEPVARKVSQIIRYSEDRMNIKQIADVLNKEGFLTPRNKPWSEANTSNLIKEFNIPYKKKSLKS